MGEGLIQNPHRHPEGGPSGLPVRGRSNKLFVEGAGHGPEMETLETTMTIEPLREVSVDKFCTPRIERQGEAAVRTVRTNAAAARLSQVTQRRNRSEPGKYELEA